MAFILYIETSTRNCSVCIAENDRVIASKCEMDTQSHAKIIQTLINEVLIAAKIEMKMLNAVAVSGGPGSYTGLRIGMSVAKGICFALAIPLIALDSLESLAFAMVHAYLDNEGVYMATLDSRKGEIYYCAMNAQGELLEPSQPAIVDQLNWNKYNYSKIYLAGNTNVKLKDIIFATDNVFLDLEIKAENMISKGFKVYQTENFENLVSVEPRYLKPFI